MSPELTIIILNATILFIGYIYLFPKYAASNLAKLTTSDLLASIAALTIVGSQYWGSGYQFNAVLFKANWFWFTLLTYFITELPFLAHYAKKYKVFE